MTDETSHGPVDRLVSYLKLFVQNYVVRLTYRILIKNTNDYAIYEIEKAYKHSDFKNKHFPIQLHNN